MRKGKRSSVLAILLTLVMILSMSTTLAFADFAEEINANEDIQGEENIFSDEEMERDASSDVPDDESAEEYQLNEEEETIGLVTGLTAKWSGSSIEIAWEETEGAGGYYIYRAAEFTDEDSFVCISKIEGGNTLTYLDSEEELSKKTIYIYKVCAYSNNDGEEIVGEFSDKAYSGEIATRIPVLTYHRLIADKKFKKVRSSRSLFVKSGDFAKQMKWLNDNGYRTLSTDEFADWYDGKIELPKKVVLITFDDGNYSVIKYGLPTLKKYNQKATIFMIGKLTKAKTNKKRYARDSYHVIGRDVMASVQESYPNLEFQSHTWNLHSKVKKKKPVLSFSKQKLYDDAVAQYNEFHFTALAYPWGTTSNNMIEALQDESHIRIAFTYGTNAYATRSNSRYKNSRIKISGTQSFSKFTRWF